MSENIDEKVVNLDFADFLDELDRGRVVAELGEKMLEVIAGVKQSGKAGALTLQITAGWDKKATMLRIGTKINAKVPQLDRGESLFFVDKDGKPSKDHPSQLQIVDRNAEVIDYSEPRFKKNQ